MEINTDLTLKHYSYPSIGQYRNLIHNVNHKALFTGEVDSNGDAIYDNTRSKPNLSFTGTVKLHGTNAAVILDYDKNICYFQSRTNIISPLKDNAGFALAMSKLQDGFWNTMVTFYPRFNFDMENVVIAVYGEWCGQSIQKGVAISKLPKMFVIFDICIINTKTDERTWLNRDFVKAFKLPEDNVLNIYDFPSWTIDIDFAYPELSQNSLVSITSEVERQCPVAYQLGVEGIGEGVVWKCSNPGYEDPMFWMKVKGEEHQSSKTTTLAPIVVEDIESIKEFVSKTVTDNRCNQAISVLKETNTSIDRKLLGDFISWIVRDILKEEVDTIVANNLNSKKLGKYISDAARKWFFNNEINF